MSEAYTLTQGRRHQVLFGVDGFMGTKTHLPPKLSFSSDFGHFISKMLENAKFANVLRKKILKYQFLGGTSPADFSTAGDASPPPPLSTPMPSRHVPPKSPPKGGTTARRLGGGGRGPFEVDYFYATPIGIMLNAEKFAGDRSPVPPPPPPGAAAHAPPPPSNTFRPYDDNRITYQLGTIVAVFRVHAENNSSDS